MTSHWQLSPKFYFQPKIVRVCFVLIKGGVNCGLQFVTPTARPPTCEPQWHVAPSAVKVESKDRLPAAVGHGGGGCASGDGAGGGGSWQATVLVPLTLSSGGIVDTAVLCTQVLLTNSCLVGTSILN